MQQIWYSEYCSWLSWSGEWGPTEHVGNAIHWDVCQQLGQETPCRVTRLKGDERRQPSDRLDERAENRRVTSCAADGSMTVCNPIQILRCRCCDMLSSSLTGSSAKQSLNSRALSNNYTCSVSELLLSPWDLTEVLNELDEAIKLVIRFLSHSFQRLFIMV